MSKRTAIFTTIFTTVIAISLGNPVFSQCITPACIVTPHTQTSNLNIDNGQADGGRIRFFSSEIGSRDWAVRNNGRGLGLFPGEGSSTALFLANNGNVSIGAPEPSATARLDVRDTDTIIQMRSSIPALVTGRENGGAIYFGVDNNNEAGRPTAAIETSWGDRGTNRPQMAIGIVREGKGGNLFFDHDGRASLRHGLTSRLVVEPNGNVGIGTTGPVSLLHVLGAGGGAVVATFEQPSGINYVDLRSSNAGGNYGSFLRFMQGSTENASLRSTADGQLRLAANGAERIFISSSGNVGIATANPQARLDVQGRTRTESLEITGGSDLAEPFANDGGAEIEPGMVVRIDPSRRGGLLLADGAYDRTVAGIVSGAGGVKAGVVLSDEKLKSGRTFLVALSGRVYCRADATRSPIRPGDLLTTSDVPGHAMKATDPTRTPGAVLGKAMTPLAEGRGLVLVLVSLQ